MELVNLQFLGTPNDSQEYSGADKSLLTTSYINSAFGNSQDYIEYFIYDTNNDLIGLNYNVVSFKPGPGADPTTNTFSNLYLDPLKDLQSEGINRGTYNITYNFLRNQLRTAPGFEFWIKEISATRTEIKVTRQDLSNADMAAAFDSFSGQLLSNGYYPDFYLNFAENRLVIAVNAVYIEENGVGYIIFKLYEPLPFDFNLKSRFWVVTKVAEPVQYQIDIQVEADEIDTTRKLRGPNYNIDLKQEIGAATPYYNYSTLFSSAIPTSLQQIKSLLDEKAVRINVDYSRFENYIHFSSATERLNNFAYKVGLIEFYQSSSATFSNLAPGANTNYLVSKSRAALQANIDNIITKFDPYEYYLYYTSESTAWPKSNDLYPYTLYSITSSQAVNWLGSTSLESTPTTMSMLYSASLYDELNSNCLRYTAPLYIREDGENEPYITFMDMIGQHFDNIWLYYKDVTNRFAAVNNPNKGISLDLVGDALKGLGMTLYTNTNMSDNIYYSLFGVNETGSILPITSSDYAQIVFESSSLYPKIGNDYLSASIYLPPFGNEKINKYVVPLQTTSGGLTSSFQAISPNDLEGEIYKRLYHNLPYILKAKGTERGVKALIACFGIPDTTLTVHEFGGYNMFTRPEIQGIEDLKVYTGSVQTISGDTLSPFITIQEYNNDTQRNSFDVQIGFSPADSINAHITGTLQNLNVQQLIANPALQYSSSYEPLSKVSSDYFNTYYTSRYNVWDFIRVIKYYNNALFKMIKDYVPARSSLTSGIIIKPHILERNKYARHEPVVTTSSYEQTVNILSISASDASEIKYSTAYTSYTDTPSGSVPIYNIYSFEKYTGEFSGSRIEVTNGEAFDQADYSTTLSGSVVGDINYGALFQNVTASVKSTRFLDLDYSTNQIVPVNYGLITQSINAGQAALQNPYAPYAQLQDYNYSLRRSTIPRYEGSKVSSRKYNVYTGPFAVSSSYSLPIAPLSIGVLPYFYQDNRLIGASRIDSFRVGSVQYTPASFDPVTGRLNFTASITPAFLQVTYSVNQPGDSSYGLSAAIDRNSLKVGWVNNIPEESLNFYTKTTIYLKYLTDLDNQLIELNRANNNLIDVQNIFKSGTPVIVSISDVTSPSFQKDLDGEKMIFRGGFSYDPILYREDNEDLKFEHPVPISQSIQNQKLNLLTRHSYRYTAYNSAGGALFGFANPSAAPNTTLAAQIGSAYSFEVDGASVSGLQSGITRTADAVAVNDYLLNYLRVQTPNQDQNTLINFTFSGLPATDTGRNRSESINIYRFDFFNTYEVETNTFNNTAPDLLIEDPDNNLIQKKNQYFRTPKASTYKFNGEFYLQMKLADTEGLAGPPGFKIFAILEKTSNLNASVWSYVSSTTLDLIKQGNVLLSAFTPTYNEIRFDGSYDRSTTALFRLKLSTTDNAPANTYYRLTFYIITQINIFGVGGSRTGPGANTFIFTLGTTKNTNLDPSIPAGEKSFLSIEDTQSTYTEYYYTSSYTQIPPLFTTGSITSQGSLANRSLVFSESSSFLFDTASYFSPTPANETNALLPAGTSQTGTITYYTPIIDEINIQKYDLIRIGKFKDIGASYYEVVDVQISGSNRQRVVTLSNQITSSYSTVASNFAILRPKPDETSVIINYRKRPGVVAPTILIPSDLKEEIRDSVGDIFKNLNPNLTLP